MYKTQYSAALKTAGITYDDLSEKNKAVYDETVDVETQFKELNKSLSKAPEEDKPELEESLGKLEATLAEMDKALCWKISKNEFYKENAKKLAAGRLASAKAKSDQSAAPAKSPEVKPDVKPEVKSEVKPEEKPDVKVEVKTQREQGQETTAPVANVEVKTENKVDPAIPAPAKKGDAKKEEKKGENDEKNVKSEASTGKTVALVAGGLLAAVFAYFALPIPPLNKKSFSFKFTLKRW